jgi:hypothetical protein
MKMQSCTPYRGFHVDIKVVPNESSMMEGRPRYSVSWIIRPQDLLARPVLRLSERFNFLSPDAAFRYAESHAKSFIDGCINDLIGDGVIM